MKHERRWWYLAIFPVAFPLLWPGALFLAMYLERGKPITLDSNDWECTASHTEFVGMAMGNVCDKYERRKRQ